jgi:undecaprenyl-phosphate 4-deoxy-4-formamido-L-arabinose transferase
LRISTLTGFTLSLVGALGGAAVIVDALFIAEPPGWASLFSALLLLSGVQLTILGIVGEYLGRLYLTANRKPQSVVRTVTRAEPAAPASAVPAAAAAPPVRLRRRG